MYYQVKGLYRTAVGRGAFLDYTYVYRFVSNACVGRRIRDLTCNASVQGLVSCLVVGHHKPVLAVDNLFTGRKQVENAVAVIILVTYFKRCGRYCLRGIVYFYGKCMLICT